MAGRSVARGLYRYGLWLLILLLLTLVLGPRFGLLLLLLNGALLLRPPSRQRSPSRSRN